jgi:hypothetical protein
MNTKLLFISFMVAMAAQAYPQCSYDTLAVSDLMDSLATNFPSICKKEVIGQTVLGREIVALKMSDNVTLDENEPEILLEGCIHGDEQTNFNNEPVAIDLSPLPQGIFFVKIQSGAFSETHKVIHQ